MPKPGPSRRVLLKNAAGLVLPWMTVSAAHAGFNLFTSTYTVDKDDLQTRLAARFPLRMGNKDLLAIEATAPVLSLDAKTNRVMIATRLSVSNGMLRSQTLEGVLGISSALKYQAATKSILLDQPSTDKFDLDLLSERSAELITRMGSVLVREALHDQVLYTFTPEQLKFGPKTFEPTGIKVQEDGVAITVK
jgi:hypothetical protein